MKLAQNQVYQQGESYIRIVRLERLAVQYKTLPRLLTRDGEHHDVSKKAFCRLIKGARLLTHDEVREIWLEEGAAMTPRIPDTATPESGPADGAPPPAPG